MLLNMWVINPHWEENTRFDNEDFWHYDNSNERNGVPGISC